MATPTVVPATSPAALVVRVGVVFFVVSAVVLSLTAAVAATLPSRAAEP